MLSRPLMIESKRAMKQLKCFWYVATLVCILQSITLTTNSETPEPSSEQPRTS
jgi:hypothetical protein